MDYVDVFVSVAFDCVEEVMGKEHFRDKERRELSQAFKNTIVRLIENGENDHQLEELLLDEYEYVRVAAKQRLTILGELK